MESTGSDEKRERLIQDIINHKVEEVEVGAGNEVTNEELMELRSELEEQSTTRLIDWWNGTVGEWIAPMDRFYENDEYFVEEETSDGEVVEVPIWEHLHYESHVEWQFEKLIDHGETDYGYVYPYYEQPYGV